MKRVVLLALASFFLAASSGGAAEHDKNAPPPGSPGSPGLARKPDESPDQCRRRLLPIYDAKNLAQCVEACRSCYTTSGGGKCDSYCRSTGAQ